MTNLSTEENPKDGLMKKLKDGLKNTLDSKSFADWCKLQGRLYYNHYSFNNAFLVSLQRPDASYTCGYETWKHYGRQVRQGANAIKVFSPVFAKEYGMKGSLLAVIKKTCEAQMKKDSALVYGTFQLGQSQLKFLLYKNGLFDVKFGEKVAMSKATSQEVRKFLDTNVINKLPVGYSVVSVFDISDTTDNVPHLWVSEKSCTPKEMVLDDNGNPIRNNRKQVKINNSEERRARFHIPQLGIKELDEQKMQNLYSAIKAANEKKGVPVQEVAAEQDKILSGGSKGYWKHSEKEPQGQIVISEQLSATEKVAVLLHESAHADLHGDLQKLAEDMGREKLGNAKEVIEVQAEAVAFMTASVFGLETDHDSFLYIANWSEGRELKTLEDSMNIIYRESQSLLKELEASLEEMGLTMELEPIKSQALTKEQKEKAVTEYIGFVLSAMEENEMAQNTALEELEEMSEGMHKTIVQEQISESYRIDWMLSELHNKVEKLQASENPQEQVTLQEKIQARIKQIKASINKINALSGERLIVAQEAEIISQEDMTKIYENAPMDVLQKLQVESIKSLSDRERKYIANSQYIQQYIAPCLSVDQEQFAQAALAQLANFHTALSKNGVVVEINACEEDRHSQIPAAGTLLNPKAANRIFAEMEKDIQAVQKQGGVLPYVRCQLSLYVQAGRQGLTKVDTWVNIGDGNQTDLKDHFTQLCNDNQLDKAILTKIEKSIRERSEEKILPPAKKSSGKEQSGDASKPLKVWEGIVKSSQKNINQEETPERETSFRGVK